MTEEPKKIEKKAGKELQDEISFHIFTASTTMIGVCLTVIGILHFTVNHALMWADELLAINAIGFLTSCFMSYLALRETDPKKKMKIAIIADRIFLIALTIIAIACILIAYEFAHFSSQ